MDFLYVQFQFTINQWIFELNNKDLFWLFSEKSVHAVMALLMNNETREYYIPMKINEQKAPIIKYFEGERDKLQSQINSNPNDRLNEYKKGRVKVLNESIRNHEITEILKDSNQDRFKVEMFIKIKDIILREDFKDILGSDLKEKKGKTDGYWSNIETKKKKFMIVNLGKNATIRETSNEKNIFNAEDVENKFPIIDGIDFKSNSSTDSVLYLEV